MNTLIFTIGMISCGSLLLLSIVHYRTRLAPSTVVAGSWTLGFFLCMLFAPDYQMSIEATAIAVSTVAACVAGGLLSARAFSSTRNDQSNFTLTIKGIAPLAIGSSLLLGIAAVQQFKLVGSDAQLLSQEAAAQYTRARYAEEATMLPLSSLAYGIANACVAIAGLALGLKDSNRFKGIALFVLPICGACFFTSITTARLFTIAVVLSGISGILTGLILRLNARISVQKLVRLMVALCMIFAAMSASVVAVQNLRSGDKKSTGANLSHLRPWVAGYLPGFSKWHEKYYDGPVVSPLPFNQLLNGALGMVGLDDLVRKNDVYVVFNDGSTSNALSVLRILLTDLGVIGTWLAVALYGSAGSLAIANIFRYPRFSAFVLILEFQIALWSVNNFPFSYGSQIFGAICLAILLRLCLRTSSLSVEDYDLT